GGGFRQPAELLRGGRELRCGLLRGRISGTAGRVGHDLSCTGLSDSVIHASAPWCEGGDHLHLMRTPTPANRPNLVQNFRFPAPAAVLASRSIRSPPGSAGSH